MKENWEILRIFTGEQARYNRRPFYEAVVNIANELGLSGATVFRGSMGFGPKHMVHTSKILCLSEDLPVVVEIADRPENLDKLMPFLKENMKHGLIAREKVSVFIPGKTP